VVAVVRIIEGLLKPQQGRGIGISHSPRSSLLSASRRLLELAKKVLSSAKIAQNFLCQDFIDLSMPWNWLGTSSSRLMKNVVPPSMAQQNTTSLLQLSDQISALQATTNVPILRMPGRSSLENSQ
jgi:hypothetical protein